MTYRVVLQRLAVEDLNAAYLHVAGHAPKTAARWFERFQAALQTLDQRPDRCPFAPEKRKVGIELREFQFGRPPNVFRAIFLIDGEAVRILRVRRAQRRSLSRQEINEAREIDN
jgi:plasmid stabilization system protein ParE